MKVVFIDVHFQFSCSKEGIIEAFQLPNHQVVVIPFHIDAFVDG